MKNLFGALLLVLFGTVVAIADEITVNEFLDWAENNGFGVYTNWEYYSDQGTNEVVMAAVNDDGVVIQEGVFDASTQEGHTTESGESFTDWLGRWGFLRCGISCTDGGQNFSPR